MGRRSLWRIGPRGVHGIRDEKSVERMAWLAGLGLKLMAGWGWVRDRQAR